MPSTQPSHPNQPSLNKEQRQAVTHPPDVPLQILAGPGSGKTKVLTSRVAYLVQQQGIPPSQICCVTFTNKAANEMRERLKKLVGVPQTDALVMGTFHALCARFLRKYGSHISLRNNFTICDAEESKKIISKIIKEYADELSAMSIQLKDSDVLSAISKAKAKGLAPHELGHDKTPRDRVQEFIARIYADYTRVLKENNSLDFDDLLVFGVRLFSKVHNAVSWCRHVLVDEFQDTNSMQYELMVRLASVYRCITIVGDPDQSIYGWRSAEVTNLGRMRKDFPSTQQILLEQNYRSTGSILAASLAIVAEDKSRIAKSLRTTHPSGASPTLRSFPHDQAEAESIAKEIKRLVAYHGGLLGWNDFVILLRFNALSRVVEAALQKEGIPNRVLAGQKFFERLEIKDILAYLQVIDNPSYAPAFNRAVNTPPRGIGEKSISELSTRAKKLGISSMEVAERIFLGKTPDIKPAVKRKLEGFIRPIMTLRVMANEGASVPDLIQRLLVQVSYEDHLKRSQQDWETRWENVQELINFASQSGTGTTVPDPAFVARESAATGNNFKMQTLNGEEVIDLVSDDEDEANSLLKSDETPLRLFLQASMLSTDTETKDESQGGEKVTISTCHSAKGLEWPVVFIPAVEKGTFPFYRAEDIEEERRLLYVACTRAQGLLYLSYSTRRMAGGEWTTKDMSEFISVILKKNRSLFSQSPPSISQKERHETACLLDRKAIDETTALHKIQEYNQTIRLHAQNNKFNNAPPFTMNRPVQASSNSLPFVVPAPFSYANACSQPYASGSKPTASTANTFTSSGIPSNVMQRSVPPAFITSSKHTTAGPLLPLNIPNYFIPAPSISSPLDVQIHHPLEPAKDPRIEHQTVKLAAGKRRLGMGRIGTGYPNKKPREP